MKKCRRCGSLLPDDATFCTVCNMANPFDVEKKKTAYDLTMAINPLEKNAALYRVKSRKKLLLYAWLLGFTGVPFKYLGFAKKALISLGISVLLVIALVLLCYFLISKNFVFCLLSALAALVIVNVVLGIYFTTHPSLKDSFGEYLR